MGPRGRKKWLLADIQTQDEHQKNLKMELILQSNHTWQSKKLSAYKWR